jgi:hypothetical protein
MSLQKYTINFLQMTPYEKAALKKLLNAIAVTSISFNSDIGQYFIDEDFDTSLIELPDLHSSMERHP